MPLVERILSDLVRSAVHAAQADGTLPALDVPADVPLGRAKRAEWGDYSTAVALQMAGAAGRPPLAVADVIREHLPPAPIVGAALPKHSIPRRALSTVIPVRVASP